MTVEEQKAIADILLRKLQAIDPNCIVAGGAPRDWYLGREAKDIDIFVYLPQIENNTQIRRRFRGLDLHPEKMARLIDEDDPQYDNPAIQSVWEGKLAGIIYQVILMNAPTFDSVIPMFDANIVKAWYKDGQIRATPDFVLGHRNKQIILADPIQANSRHVRRLRELFPDYEFNYHEEDNPVPEDVIAEKEIL